MKAFADKRDTEREERLYGREIEVRAGHIYSCTSPLVLSTVAAQSIQDWTGDIKHRILLIFEFDIKFIIFNLEPYHVYTQIIYKLIK